MRIFARLLVSAIVLSLLYGCGGPTVDISRLKPEDRFNPAISATQRQHMMNRGPKPPPANN